MKKVLFLVAVVLAAFAASASAQSKTERKYHGYNRLFVSYNPYTTYDDWDDYEVNNTGLSLGYTHGFSIAKKLPFYLEIGGRLTYAFGDYEDTEYQMYYQSIQSHTDYENK